MVDDTETKRKYLTTPQAAQLSGFSKTYLTQLLRKGILEGFRLGRDWLIYTDSLERFLATNRKPGPKGPRKKTSQEHPNTTSSDGSGGTGSIHAS
jgi:excisionase family DNA binding protein